MLERVDHIGYLVRNLDGAIAEFEARFALNVVRRFERPQFSLAGAYLGDAPGSIELFTFSDEAVLARRLGDASIVLDHVAYSVRDVVAASERLARGGARFTGPDECEELSGPVELGGVRHLWTIAATTAGLRIQLVER